MAPRSRLMFINLPVQDLSTSMAFFRTLGFTFDPRFTNDEAACLVISELAYIMLLPAPKFAGLTPTPVADAHATSEVLLAISAESRQAVDALADAALTHGGAPANAPLDAGFVYERTFLDPDGHLWAVIWMSPEAADAGPAELAQRA